MECTMGFRTMLDIEILLAVCVAFEFGFAQDGRVIDETPLTVKVISGSTAILPCSVDPNYTEGLDDSYIVLWQNPKQTVISVRDRRVLSDMRISVERPYLSDWNLHIRNVSVQDSGEYKCQINTDPVSTKRVKLVVQVPPMIVSYTQPDNVKVRVGDHVDLKCNATGIPHPTITWYRLNMATTRRREKVGQMGWTLRIHNISRACADTYECVANNSVPPSRSRQIIVTVQYPPEIRLLNSKISQMRGKETILECIITASPLGVTQWIRNGQALTKSFKYELDVYREELNKITLSLRIAEINEDDYGDYLCEASNSLGRTLAIMKLVEAFPPTTTRATTTTTLARRIYVLDNRNDDHTRNYNQQSWNGDNGFLDEKDWRARGQNTHQSRKRPMTPPTKHPSNGKHSAEQTHTGVFGTGSVVSKGSGSRACASWWAVMGTSGVLALFRKMIPIS